MQELFTPSWLLVYGGLGLMLLELFIGIETGFDLVLIGTTLIIGGGVGNLLTNWQLGLTVTIILAAAYVLLGRKYLRNKLSFHSQHTNVDAVMGKTGIVTKGIAPHQAGQVKIESEVWRATSNEKIATGLKVRVGNVDGVSVHVVKSN